MILSSHYSICSYYPVERSENLKYIPETVKDLTPDWFTSILDLHENSHVESVKLQSLGEKDSVSGYIYRAQLSFSSKTQEAPRSIVLKMPRSRDQRTPFLLKAYIREVRFYQLLAHNVGIHVPKLIYADVNIGTSDYILALEDFPESTNVRNEIGATQDQTYNLLENMAKLHAQYWEDPELSAYEFLNNLEDIMEIYSTDLPKCVPVFLSRFSHLLEPDDIAFIEALSEHFQVARIDSHNRQCKLKKKSQMRLFYFYEKTKVCLLYQANFLLPTLSVSVLLEM